MAAEKEKKLSRIYQGRAITCKDTNDKPIDNFEEILLTHHQLFQDAVNYYLCALVAMSKSEDKIFGRIQEQLVRVWNDFYKNGSKREGIKHSIYRIYKDERILDSVNGFHYAKDLILEYTTVQPEILQAALNHIAEKCKGDVTQPSKTYFPQLCEPSFGGNWDLDRKAFEEAAGKNKLIDALYSDSPVKEILELLPDMELGWCGIKTQTGKYFVGEEAKASLKDAIQYFIDSPTAYVSTQGADTLKRYLIAVDEMTNISFGRNNKADPKRRNAMWLLRFFPDDFTVGLMKSILSLKEKTEHTEMPEFGDDPVKLSRGDRGYIFHSFTKLKIWKKLETDWRAFDMEAFKEALKTINQFNQKTDERNKQLAEIQSIVDWMDGKISKCPKSAAADDAEEDSSPLPVLAGDPRWDALRKLQKDLQIQNCWTEDEAIEYGLNERTIRSFGILRSLWNKILIDEVKKSTEPEMISKKLVEALHQFQAEHRDEMGSADLYHGLAAPENFCIWSDSSNINGKDRSNDILKDAVKYYSCLQEIEKLREPIQITPADARNSRRTSDLKALGGAHIADGVYKTKLAAKGDNGLYEPVEIRICYSAPRLQRDGLIFSDGGSIYLPPVLQAFIQKEEAQKQEFTSSSAFLMPDWDKDGKLRLLLNFPVSLDVSAFKKMFDSRFADEKQFYYANSVNACLMWPEYKHDKRTASWHRSAQPFDFISVDLGQRSAAAVCRANVSIQNQKYAVWLGNDGKHDWFAKRTYAELLRLPGEDAKVIRDQKITREYSGKNGRPADIEESEEARKIIQELYEDAALLYDARGEIIPFFPQQNDKLLVAFRRATGKLKKLERWMWMLSEEQYKEKALTELQIAEWLTEKSPSGVQQREKHYREMLPKILVQIADRILPLRGRHWKWEECVTEEGLVYWKLTQTERGTSDAHKKICGQRGLSFARLEQLEELRKRCQSLNRILMRTPGAKTQSVKEMREMIIPDCCPDILTRLDHMKEQRINQTANMILAQALGLRHKVHGSTAEEREKIAVHGEYERIPGVPVAAFIVLENLSRYKFSQDRSPYENTRLMKWAHRALVEKLKMLCEVIGMPVLEVPAAYSSKFSADALPGFRAEECKCEDLSAFQWQNDKIRDPREKSLLEAIRKIHLEMLEYDANAMSVMPKNGGPVFIPYCGSDDLKQADINAAFNIGLRAVANGKNLLCNNRLSADFKKDHWVIRKNTQFAKMVYTMDCDIDYLPEKKLKQNSGNFFVIGCPAACLGIPEENIPHFRDPDMDKKYFLMFGGKVLHDRLAQLQRCLEINEKRLDKLKTVRKK